MPLLYVNHVVSKDIPTLVSFHLTWIIHTESLLQRLRRLGHITSKIGPQHFREQFFCYLCAVVSVCAQDVQNVS